MGCHAGKLSADKDIDTGWIYIKCVCSKKHAVYMEDRYIYQSGEKKVVETESAVDLQDKFTCGCGETLDLQNATEFGKTKWEMRPIQKNDENYTGMNIKGKEKKRKQNSKKRDDIDKLSDDFHSHCRIQDNYVKSDEKRPTNNTAKAKRKLENEGCESELQKKTKTDNIAKITEHTMCENDTAGDFGHHTENHNSELQTENKDSDFQATNKEVKESHYIKAVITNNTENALAEEDDQPILQEPVDTDVKCGSNKNENEERISSSLDKIKQDDNLRDVDTCQFQTDDKDNDIQAKSKEFTENHAIKAPIKNTENASGEVDDQPILQESVDTDLKYGSNKNENGERLTSSLDEINQDDNSRGEDNCQTKELPDQIGHIIQTTDSENSNRIDNDEETLVNKEEGDKERIRCLENEINKLKEKECDSTELKRQMDALQDTIQTKSKENTKQKEELEDLRQANQEIKKTAHDQQLELERSNRESVKTLKRLQEAKGSLEADLNKVSKQKKENKEELQKQAKKLQAHEMYWKEKQSLHQFQEKIHASRPKPLRNLGNTCFMDAMLQNIAWCPKLGDELKKQLIDMHAIDNTKQREMTYCIFNLVRYTHSTESSNELSKSSVPERILQAARRRNDVFNGYRQQDSFEMFNTIVDGLKDELLSFYKQKEQVKGNEEIVRKYGAVRLFYGKFVNVYTYSSCEHHVESVLQSFTSVTVPIIKRKHDYQETPTSHSDNNYEGSSNAKSGKRGKRKKKNKKRESKLNGSEATNIMEFPENQNSRLIHTADDPPAKKAKKSQSSSDEEVFHDALEAIVNVDTKSAGTQTDEHNSELSSIENLTNPRDVNNSPIGSMEIIYSRKRVLPFDTLKQSDSHETDIEYGLSHGLMAEETFGEDIMSCRKCTSPSRDGICNKKMFIFEAPYILILHIDRFKEDNHGGLLKRNDLVTYPAELDLKPFLTAAAEKEQKDKELRYKLYGVVVHSGSINSGHYVAYIKTSGRSKAAWYDEIAGRSFIDPAIKKQEVESFLEGKDLKQSSESDDETAHWFYISDEHINECSENEALNNQNAYVLMYEKL